MIDENVLRLWLGGYRMLGVFGRIFCVRSAPLLEVGCNHLIIYILMGAISCLMDIDISDTRYIHIVTSPAVSYHSRTWQTKMALR